MKPRTVQIRVLSERDAEEYRRLRLEALEREPQAFAESVEEHRATTLETTAARLRAKPVDGNFVLGAFAGGQLIGMAGFVREHRQKMRHRGRVFGVYVAKAWRAKGIARALLSELLRLAWAQPGLEQVSLSVSAGQTAANRLYRSLGFERYGHERQALKIANDYVDMDLMVLAAKAGN